jgi:ABC transporter substrate binding protein (PQQ-dependent alcohol dehydrogenase system)
MSPGLKSLGINLQTRYQILNLTKNLWKLLIAFCVLSFSSQLAAALEIPVLYLKQTLHKPPALSNILPPAKNSGIMGAKLAISDNNSAGKFLQQHYQLTQYESDKPEQLLQQARQWLEAGNRFIVVNAPADTLLRLSGDNIVGGNALIFNTSSLDNSLRIQNCQTGLLHTIPSRAMLTDALMQFLVKKRWRKWFLIKGSRAEDELFSRSLKHSSKRFGAQLVAEKTWSFDTDLRRSATREIPAFTQADDYDVIVTADESGDFGEYIPYNSWLPRPVAGTQGLTPTAWHRVVEQWGAAQLQSRFEKLSGRWMNSQDYASWLAIRSIAEAVSRTSSIDYKTIYQYLLSADFQLGGFKGRKLNFRTWNGQMRQPIPLIHPRALVATAPLEGFLHPRTELDSLGYDQPEVSCKFETTIEN